MWATDRAHPHASFAWHCATGVGLLLVVKCVAAQPVITDADIERARRLHRIPSEQELERIAPPTAPRVDALPQPRLSTPAQQSGGVDLEAIARGFPQSEIGIATHDGKPRLLVFISFAMPEASLRRLIVQVQQARGTLVLRGPVDGSFVETASKLKSLASGANASIQIDPQAFERFSITRTPTFVLASSATTNASCSTGTCVPSQQYLATAGDVTLAYALRHMARRVSGEFEPLHQEAAARGRLLSGTQRPLPPLRGSSIDWIRSIASYELND